MAGMRPVLRVGVILPLKKTRIGRMQELLRSQELGIHFIHLDLETVQSVEDMVAALHCIFWKEFVNHGGRLVKGYVLGETILIAERNSLPDLHVLQCVGDMVRVGRFPVDSMDAHNEKHGKGRLGRGRLQGVSPRGPHLHGCCVVQHGRDRCVCVHPAHIVVFINTGVTCPRNRQTNRQNESANQRAFIEFVSPIRID
ncbi:Aste57867_17501 [Aphanomyces stellatus]|uniref:Aste57867_17501 protein n=1 Tax=Aphanomyces stellatus TaxID=120398 RepID=A0A485L8N3_9STRA|nr:hypothetical protein As57867_017441 [Aphanomyces stellatus]VFT94254.1 Aste57867_17501 [Aphanomyces stellatus]